MLDGQMKKILIYLLLIVLGIQVSIPSSSQVQPRNTTSLRMIVKVSPTPQKGIFLFDVNGQRIPTKGILDFLNKHWDENSERTVPIVMIPASLTLIEIGAIEAMFTKAGYQKVRFFLYEKKS